MAQVSATLFDTKPQKRRPSEFVALHLMPKTAHSNAIHSIFMANNRYIKGKVGIGYGQDELRSYKYNSAESCVILDCSFCGTCHSPLFMTNSKSETAIILTTGTVDEATELES